MPPLYYKYYSQLSDDQMQLYDTQSMENQTYAQERGTLLGITVPNTAKWLSSEIEGPAKGCLIKVYDEMNRLHKLNDIVTFVGLLEYV